MNTQIGLSYNARKALSVQVGEEAGTEIANLIQRMAAQIEQLKRSKVNVTPVVPDAKKDDHLSSTLESETF
ncbi:MAG: hypothetical protein VXZ82_24420 [Planctomycetota bacterium]|nr:hypothetical protein [Planctomycetota bacterium]